MNDLDVNSRSQDYGGSWNLCSQSVVKLHEAAQIFMMVDYVGKTIVKKSCKCSDYGSLIFVYLLFFSKGV